MSKRAERARLTKAKNTALSLPINDFIEDSRVLKVLTVNGINTVGDLMLKTDHEVKSMPGMGQSLFLKLEQELRSQLLHLRPAAAD